jgi:P-type Cu+ transporter
VAMGALYPAFGMQLNPMLAAAAMAMSSVSVVTNSLRLRGFTPPRDANAILHPGLGARVREWGYLAAIALLALAVGLGAFWASRQGGMSGMTNSGSQNMAAMSAAPVAPVAAGVRVEWSAAPAVATPGQPVTLRYRLTDARTGRAVTDLPLEHERPMHLVIVSADLAHFAHLHPAVDADGAWSVTYAPPAAGAYTLYTEFDYNGKTVLDRRELLVNGNVAWSGPLAVDQAPQTVDGVTVSLQAPAALTAGQDATFTLIATDAATGQPVTDFAPYLGAAAHVVIVAEGSGDFVHTHGEAGAQVHNGEMAAPPSAFGPAVSFDTTFAAPGRYKIWTQFNHHGQVLTVAYVVEVR